MKKLNYLTILSLSLVLTACGKELQIPKTESPTSDVVSSPKTHAATPTQSESSALLGVLTIFSHPDVGWSEFNSASGVQWNDAKPIQSNNEFSRNGRLLLNGFGLVELPNGQVGSANRAVKGNEGVSGVNLIGNKNVVTEIALVKYNPTPNYRVILRNQLGEAVTVKPLTKQCADMDTGESRVAFFELGLSAGQSVFVQASVDEEGSKNGPGSTFFNFYRDKPTSTMQQLNCK
ncbi:MAG: hypothetical protein ACRCV6_09375 [Formosimonas sp.]